MESLKWVCCIHSRQREREEKWLPYSCIILLYPWKEDRLPNEWHQTRRKTSLQQRWAEKEGVNSQAWVTRRERERPDSVFQNENEMEATQDLRDHRLSCLLLLQVLRSNDDCRQRRDLLLLRETTRLDSAQISQKEGVGKVQLFGLDYQRDQSSSSRQGVVKVEFETSKYINIKWLGQRQTQNLWTSLKRRNLSELSVKDELLLYRSFIRILQSFSCSRSSSGCLSILQSKFVIGSSDFSNKSIPNICESKQHFIRRSLRLYQQLCRCSLQITLWHERRNRINAVFLSLQSRVWFIQRPKQWIQTSRSDVSLLLEFVSTETFSIIHDGINGFRIWGSSSICRCMVSLLSNYGRSSRNWSECFFFLSMDGNCR